MVIDLKRKISNLINTYQVLPTCKVLKRKVGVCISQVRLGFAAVTKNPEIPAAFNNKGFFLSHAPHPLEVGKDTQAATVTTTVSNIVGQLPRGIKTLGVMYWQSNDIRHFHSQFICQN